MQPSIFFFSIVGRFTRVPDCLKIILLEHTAQILALELDTQVNIPCYRRKSLTMVGGTRTQVLADRMNIVTSEPQPIFFVLLANIEVSKHMWQLTITVKTD